MQSKNIGKWKQLRYFSAQLRNENFSTFARHFGQFCCGKNTVLKIYYVKITWIIVFSGGFLPSGVACEQVGIPAEGARQWGDVEADWSSVGGRRVREGRESNTWKPLARSSPTILWLISLLYNLQFTSLFVWLVMIFFLNSGVVQREIERHEGTESEADTEHT